jgi:hypothetical protein
MKVGLTKLREYKYFYCKYWFVAKKRSTKIWSEEQAKKANDEIKLNSFSQ